MKALKLGITAACAAAALLPAIAGQAQDTIVFGGSGSSALFSAVGTAAYQVASNGTNPATYTSKTGASIVDTTTGSSISTSGNIWIVYSGTAGNYQIYYDLSVDSGVGDRSFFNSDTVSLNTSTLSTTGDDLLENTTGVADTPLASVPAEVINAINSSILQEALTDITPVDALAAYNRAHSLGYNASTTPIKAYTNGNSTLAVKTVPIISFSLSSKSYQLQAVGATPVIVFVNKTSSAAGHFGDTTKDLTGLDNQYDLANNIDRYVLADYLSGVSFRTRDTYSYGGTRATATAGGSSTVAQVPVQVFEREIISGTYWTVEEDVVGSREIGQSQENTVNTTTYNPLHKEGKDGSYRTRVIGTGDMINAVINTTDGLGYAFWAANFPSTNTALYDDTKYLTVDGVDPLQDAYVDGSYPGSTDISFKNIKNGSYPIWSILRAVLPSNPSPALTSLFTQVAALSAGSDFVKLSDLQVFRSHYTPNGITGITPHDGVVSFNEAGGDAGGAVTPLATDIDYYLDFSKELVNRKL